MYQYIADHNMHAAKFYHLLDNAIQVVNDQNAVNYLRFVKQYADARFSITKIASQWQDLLTSLKAEYPSVESRALPKPVFRYHTA